MESGLTDHIWTPGRTASNLKGAWTYLVQKRNRAGSGKICPCRRPLLRRIERRSSIESCAVRFDYALDTGYRVQHHGEEWMPRAAAGGIAQPVRLKSNDEAALVYERNGLKVTAFKVEHDPATPAYGYRFEYRGRLVVVSATPRRVTISRDTRRARTCSFTM